MGHSHRPGTVGQRSYRGLAATLVLAAIYMVAEVLGGLWTGSLALLADAGHMLSDVAALGLSLFAIWMTRRPATDQRTFGYHRTEILAALANGAALVAISIFIFVEAIGRFREPPVVQGGPMLVIAAGGLVVNLLGLALLHGGRDESLNLRGAWLHVLTDTLGSIEAMVAGVLIWAFGWRLADPVASILIGLLVAYSSFSLLRESVAVLMEGTPGHLDLDEVRRAILEVTGALDVHDLHAWTITSGFVALSAHVVCAGSRPPGHLLEEVRGRLHEDFGIDHITIQVEPEGFDEGSPAV